jgi:hypothetical protein
MAPGSRGQKGRNKFSMQTRMIWLRLQYRQKKRKGAKTLSAGFARNPM